MLSKKCLNCGKLFYKHRHSVTTWRQLKNCSLVCRSSYNAVPPKTCISCGKLFFKGDYSISVWNQLKNCSNDCRLKNYVPWNKGRLSPETQGVNSPHWKGGATILNKAIRLTKHYLRWRTAIQQRDNYKCVLCGESSKIVDHYPTPFSTLIVKYQIENVQQARSCPQFWDITNGRILCEECHRQTDTYGYKSVLKKINGNYEREVSLGR